MERKLLSYFQIYYIASVIKTRSIGQEETDCSFKSQGKLRASPEYTQESRGQWRSICMRIRHGQDRSFTKQKTGHLKTNNEVRCPPHTLCQNSLQIYQIFKNNKSIKLLEDNKTEYLHHLEGWKVPFKHWFRGRNYAGKDQWNSIKIAETIKTVPHPRETHSSGGAGNVHSLPRRPAGSVCTKII